MPLLNCRASTLTSWMMMVASSWVICPKRERLFPHPARRRAGPGFPKSILKDITVPSPFQEGFRHESVECDFSSFSRFLINLNIFSSSWMPSLFWVRYVSTHTTITSHYSFHNEEPLLYSNVAASSVWGNLETNLAYFCIYIFNMFHFCTVDKSAQYASSPRYICLFLVDKQFIHAASVERVQIMEGGKTPLWRSSERSGAVGRRQEDEGASHARQREVNPLWKGDMEGLLPRIRSWFATG